MALFRALIPTNSVGSEPESPEPNSFNDAEKCDFHPNFFASYCSHWMANSRVTWKSGLSSRWWSIYTNQEKTATVGLRVVYDVDGKDVEVLHGIVGPNSYPISLMSNGAHDQTGCYWQWVIYHNQDRPLPAFMAHWPLRVPSSLLVLPLCASTRKMAPSTFKVCPNIHKQTLHGSTYVVQGQNFVPLRHQLLLSELLEKSLRSSGLKTLTAVGCTYCPFNIAYLYIQRDCWLWHSTRPMMLLEVPSRNRRLAVQWFAPRVDSCSNGPSSYDVLLSRDSTYDKRMVCI